MAKAPVGSSERSRKPKAWRVDLDLERSSTATSIKRISAGSPQENGGEINIAGDGMDYDLKDSERLPLEP